MEKITLKELKNYAAERCWDYLECTLLPEIFVNPASLVFGNLVIKEIEDFCLNISFDECDELIISSSDLLSDINIAYDGNEYYLMDEEDEENINNGKFRYEIISADKFIDKNDIFNDVIKFYKSYCNGKNAYK